MDIAAFIAGLPKVDLHCHIADAIPAPMLFDIAEANGIALSPHTPQTIYQATGFEDYLERLALVCSALARRRRRSYRRHRPRKRANRRPGPRRMTWQRRSFS